MAQIGMKYPVYAVIDEEEYGSAIDYNTGAILAHAISATVTQNRRDNPLYADDTKVQNDKGMTDYTIDLELDDVPIEARVALLGETAVTTGTGTTTVTHYEVTADSTPYVGFGYMRIRQVGDDKIYESYWFHKMQFALTTEEAATKREQIEWGTPKLTGTGFGVVIDTSGKEKMYDHMEFASEDSALAWLKARAGITTTGVGG